MLERREKVMISGRWLLVLAILTHDSYLLLFDVPKGSAAYKKQLSARTTEVRLPYNQTGHEIRRPFMLNIYNVCIGYGGRWGGFDLNVCLCDRMGYRRAKALKHDQSLPPYALTRRSGSCPDGSPSNPRKCADTG